MESQSYDAYELINLINRKYLSNEDGSYMEYCDCHCSEEVYDENTEVLLNLFACLLSKMGGEIEVSEDEFFENEYSLSYSYDDKNRKFIAKSFI